MHCGFNECRHKEEEHPITYLSFSEWEVDNSTPSVKSGIPNIHSETLYILESFHNRISKLENQPKLL